MRRVAVALLLGLFAIASANAQAVKRHEFGVGIGVDYAALSLWPNDIVYWYEPILPLGREFAVGMAQVAAMPELLYSYRFNESWSAGARLGLVVNWYIPGLRPNLTIQYRLAPKWELGLDLGALTGFSLEFDDRWNLFVAPSLFQWNLDLAVAAAYKFRF